MKMYIGPTYQSLFFTFSLKSVTGIPAQYKKAIFACMLHRVYNIVLMHL